MLDMYMPNYDKQAALAALEKREKAAKLKKLLESKPEVKPYHAPEGFRPNWIYLGHVLNVLKSFPDHCVDMVMTSPPYWGLRDYGGIEQDWGDWHGELGQEPTPELYIEHCMIIMEELWRVLKPRGTLWWNISDTYAGSGGAGGDWGKGKRKQSAKWKQGNAGIKHGLVGVPEMFVLAMKRRGWLRWNTIIWYKRNCMPQSVKNRFTVDFEYLYYFSKQKDRYFKQQFDPLTWTGKGECRFGGNKAEGFGRETYSGNVYDPKKLENGRNKRCVWTINPKGFKGAHFAVFPRELVQTPINAGCPRFICEACGLPMQWVVKKGEKDLKLIKKSNWGVDKNGEYHGTAKKDYQKGGAQNASEVKARIIEGMKKKTGQWKAQCECNAKKTPGIVLDPFMGAGTTAKEALQQGKLFVGCEVNPEYRAIALNRIDVLLNNRRLI